MKLCILLSLLLGSAMSDRRITEGDETTVDCENEGRVSWSKLANGKREIIKAQLGEEDPVQSKSDYRFSLLSNLSLVIKNASVSDSGIYYCNATAVLNLTVTPLKVISTDDTSSSFTGGGVYCVERVLSLSLAALIFLLVTIH